MRLSTLAIAATVLVAGTASAASPATGSFKVTASVANSCVVTSTSDINFGAYDPAVANNTTALNGAGWVKVRCTRGTTPAVQLDQGANAAGGSTCLSPARQMASGADRLGYTLYSDSGRTTPWGCDATNDVDYTFLDLNPHQFDVYGRIPAGQDVAAGNYSDTVNVSVIF